VGWVTVKVHGRALRFALSRRVARALPSGQPPNRHLRNHHGHRLELHPLVCSLQGRNVRFHGYCGPHLLQNLWYMTALWYEYS